MSKIGDECSLKLLEIIKLSIDNKHFSELESFQSISQVVVECMLQPVVGAVFAAAMTIAMGLISVELNELQGLLDTREDRHGERDRSSRTNQYFEPFYQQSTNNSKVILISFSSFVMRQKLFLLLL